MPLKYGDFNRKLQVVRAVEVVWRSVIILRVDSYRDRPSVKKRIVIPLFYDETKSLKMLPLLVASHSQATFTYIVMYVYELFESHFSLLVSLVSWLSIMILQQWDSVTLRLDKCSSLCNFILILFSVLMPQSNAA